MIGLFRCLRAAAHQWRCEKRDFKLMKVFLQSPERRWELIKEATSDAGFLMLALWGFAESDLQVAEAKFKYTMTTPTGQDLTLPPPMASRWLPLIWAAIRDAVDHGDGYPFPVVTEKGIVSVYVEEEVAKLPHSDDLMKEGLEQPRTFIFSKTPPTLMDHP